MDFADEKRRQEEEGIVFLTCGGQNVRFDLRQAATALWRVGDVATINRDTAQELSEAFNAAMAVLQQIINRAAEAEAAASQEVKRVWSQLLLEHVPKELERLGLRDSEDRRKAIVQVHPDYAAALELERHLTWQVADLRGKKERVYRANNTTLAVMGHQPYHRGGVSGGNRPAAAPINTNPSSPYGQARY